MSTMKYRRTGHHATGPVEFKIEKESQLALISVNIRTSAVTGDRYPGFSLWDEDHKWVMTVSGGYATPANDEYWYTFGIGASNTTAAPNKTHVRSLPDCLVLKEGWVVKIEDMNAAGPIDETFDQYEVVIGLMQD